MYLAVGLFLMLTGWIGIKRPDIAWYLEIGWQLSDAEPSELSLAFNRIIGWISLIFGICFIIAFFSELS